MGRVGEIAHAACVIEMQGRIDDVAYVPGPDPHFVELPVDRVVAGEPMGSERSFDPGPPIALSAVRIGNSIITAGIPQNHAVSRMLEDRHCRGYRHLALSKRDQLGFLERQWTSVYHGHSWSRHSFLSRFWYLAPLKPLESCQPVPLILLDCELQRNVPLAQRRHSYLGPISPA